MLEVWGAVRAMLEIMINFRARMSNVCATIARKLGISNQPEYHQRVLIALIYDRNVINTVSTPGAHIRTRHR